MDHRYSPHQKCKPKRRTPASQYNVGWKIEKNDTEKVDGNSPLCLSILDVEICCQPADIRELCAGSVDSLDEHVTDIQRILLEHVTYLTNSVGRTSKREAADANLFCCVHVLSAKRI